MEDVICKVKSWVQVLLVLVQQPFVPLAPLTAAAVYTCAAVTSLSPNIMWVVAVLLSARPRVRESVDGHVHVHQLLPLAAVE